MEFLSLQFDVVNSPALDPGFIPMAKVYAAHQKRAAKPIIIAIERNSGYVSVWNMNLIGTPEMAQTDRYVVERIVKFLLWQKGGYRITICGDRKMFAYIRDAYSETGARAFDVGFMSRVYERPFAVDCAELCDAPKEKSGTRSIGNHTKGCKIGFDAGGSDRKVSAVIDGACIYSEEVVWHPKTISNPDYHYNEILTAFKTAASKMPRVDGIGVSSAGVFVDNRAMVASLFIKVPEEQFDRKVKDIYLRAARTFGDVPITVINDGDVTALAGAMTTGKTAILGIAMGTSEAVGYVNDAGEITGWLNELAFAPVDANPGAVADEWSGDIGVGCKYFSQDAVLKMIAAAGVALPENPTPAEILSTVQKALVSGHRDAGKIFDSIGCYLGHTVALYAIFYEIRCILLLGRVMSGEGGDRILAAAKHTLQTEYPKQYAGIELMTPDDKMRRLGQAVAAASL